MNCLSCGKYLENFHKASEHYYLGRPCSCYGSPENTNETCKDFVKNTKEYYYPYGGIHFWKKDSDGNIYPYTSNPEGMLYETWFSKGFEKALEILNSKDFKKSCSNCHQSNLHIINRCEKNELCEKYKLDFLRFFDKEFYGHLCDSCEKSCKKTNLNKLLWECKDFKGKE